MDNSKYIQIELDWSQLQYNSLYHTYNFIASEFRGDYSNIPEFDKIIENIPTHINLKLSLEELLTII